MSGRTWTAQMLGWVLAGALLWPAGLLAQGQPKGTGATGGITGGTGGTGSTKDIEDQTGPPGSNHPKTSSYGWGRLKGKPPAGAAPQGTMGRNPRPASAEPRGWDPGGAHLKGKQPPKAEGFGPGLGLAEEQTPPTKLPRAPKGPKGPNLPPVLP
jgi:hypothetical protein